MKCDVHITHRPVPLRFVQHHIQPQGMGGPDSPNNLVAVCDTGHFNIHRLMAALIRGEKIEGVGAVSERRLAHRGFNEWDLAGRPGKPVYQLIEEASHGDT